MNVINAYLNFMLRERSEKYIPSAFETVPDFYQQTFYWGIIFCVLMVLIPKTISILFPAWYKSLDVKKIEELPAYVTSLVHHITVVPLAWWWIYNDFLVTDPNEPYVPAAYLRFAAPFCLGFIVADTFFYAIPLIRRGNVEYIIHHALAFWMTYALLSSSGHLIRYFPHIIICDTTNGFFNLAWILRLSGFRDTVLVSFLEISFAVLFFFLRIINLSTVFYLMFTSPDGNFGIGRFAFPLISLLQFYWQFKIAQALSKKFLGSGSTKKNNNNKEATTSKDAKKSS
mmetsp:Transcript_58389/g.114844  ORF Transcript_58389/g.114844 Transcript_58389/m.114844 type:complete len:285 (+) Transcript_58389:69-923(+)